MSQYSEEVGPDLRDFSGNNNMLSENVIKIDCGEGTDKRDMDDITWSTTSLTATRRHTPQYETATGFIATGRTSVFTTNDHATGN